LSKRVHEWAKGGSGIKSANPSPTRSQIHQPITDARKAKYVAALALTGSTTKSCMAADGNANTRRSYKVLESKCPRFAAQVEDALQIFSQKVADVLESEFFTGTLIPVTGAGRIITDKNGKEVWIRKRDPKIVLAFAKKYDPQLREVKTSVNLNVDATPNDGSPHVVLRPADFWQLDESDSSRLLEICRKVYSNRQQTLVDIPAPPELEDVNLIEHIPTESLDPWEVSSDAG